MVQSLRHSLRPPYSSLLVRFAFPAAGPTVSYFSFSDDEALMLRLRNFDTELHYPYCYGFGPYDRWESVANAHTAADLHVRPDP